MVFSNYFKVKISAVLICSFHDAIAAAVVYFLSKTSRCMDISLIHTNMHV